MVGKPITLTIRLYQEPELPYQWVSHCLELDIVSAAMTPTQAFEAVAGAVRLVVDRGMRGLTSEVEVLQSIRSGAVAAVKLRAMGGDPCCELNCNDMAEHFNRTGDVP